MTRSSPLSSKFDNLFARKLRDKILKKKEIFFFFFFLNKITSKSRIVFQNIFVFDAFLFLFRQHCIFAFLFFFLFLAILFLVFNFILFFFFFFFPFSSSCFYTQFDCTKCVPVLRVWFFYHSVFCIVYPESLAHAESLDQINNCTIVLRISSL